MCETSGARLAHELARLRPSKRALLGTVAIAETSSEVTCMDEPGEFPAVEMRGLKMQG